MAASVRSWVYVAVPPCFAPLRRIPRARATPSNNKSISPCWSPTILVTSLICALSCKRWRSAALSTRSFHRKPPLPRPNEAAERRTRNIGLCRRESDTGVCSIHPRPNAYGTSNLDRLRAHRPTGSGTASRTWRSSGRNISHLRTPARRAAIGTINAVKGTCWPSTTITACHPTGKGSAAGEPSGRLGGRATPARLP